MNNRAQVSLEYLISIGFVLVLVLVASVVTMNLASIANVAQAKILSFRSETIESLMG
ncbi:MAG: hypothetical protein ABID38_00895 [Candidatus Diapherotrites archaeon]